MVQQTAAYRPVSTQCMKDLDIDYTVQSKRSCRTDITVTQMQRISHIKVKVADKEACACSVVQYVWKVRRLSLIQGSRNLEMSFFCLTHLGISFVSQRNDLTSSFRNLWDGAEFMSSSVPNTVTSMLDCRSELPFVVQYSVFGLLTDVTELSSGTFQLSTHPSTEHSEWFHCFLPL